VKTRVITAAALDKLIAGWSQRGTVYAPVTVPGRDWTEFRPVKSAAEACFDHVNAKLPAKALLFPQREALLAFDAGEPAKAETPAPPPEQVILGVRPCDAAAVDFLDRFFAQNGVTDTYYQRRRERTTLIGLACNAPGPACFCSAVGGAPDATAGLDLLLTDIGGKYLAEPVTDKGAAIIEEAPDPAIGDLEAKKELAAKVAVAIPLRIDTAALKRKLDAGRESPLWTRLYLACVNCGACTFLCPSCHCFDITDEIRKGRGARIRLWDSCQFCSYSQHASGHNPRAVPESRSRNRLLDKFSYTVEMVGRVSCFGCGRCILECPAGIDIRETIAEMQAGLTEPA
jgi:ferredoxin